MLVALAVIWVGFHILSGGTFLTPRNLWNLSVQTASVAIMATGMVLIIVSRNIDLSVGSMLAVVGMAMALLQAEILPDLIGFDHPATWIIALDGRDPRSEQRIGAFQGFVVAYVEVPSFIVTLGGLLVWRGVAWWMASGRTIAPMDTTFQLLGGGSRGNDRGNRQLDRGRGSLCRHHLHAGQQPASAATVRIPPPPHLGRRLARGPGLRSGVGSRWRHQRLSDA